VTFETMDSPIAARAVRGKPGDDAAHPPTKPGRIPSLISSLAAWLDAVPEWRLRVWLAVLVGSVYLATADFSGSLVTDVLAQSAAAWQLAEHGSLTMTHYHGAIGWLVQADGREVVGRFPGTIFFAVPFYWIASSSDAVAKVAPGAVAAVTSTTASIVLLYTALRALTSRRPALAGALVAAFATSSWSISADALWTHGPTQLALSAAFLAFTRRRPGLAGLALGLAITCRPTLGVVVAAVAVGLVTHRRVRPAVAMAAGAVPGTLLVLWYNKLAFGRWGFQSGYPVGEPGWHDPAHHEFVVGMLGSLFSPERGVFVYSPVLLVLLPGVVVAWTVAPLWARYSAVAGVLHLLGTLWVVPFNGGNGFYSYRLPIETLFLAAPLLVLAYQHWTAQTIARRALFAALLVVSFYAQALGAIFYHRTIIPYPPWRSYLVIDTLRSIGTGGTIAFLGMLTATLAAVVVVMLRRAARQPIPVEGASPARPQQALSTS
jgi:alpha-1,2-mannosyltransferase